MGYQYRVDVFGALADPVRRDLLRSLSLAPARVVDLAASRPVSRPAISKHLRVLTEVGLARAETRGRERHYAVSHTGLAPVQQLLDDLQRPQMLVDGPALDALDLEVRRTVRDQKSATDLAQETA